METLLFCLGTGENMAVSALVTRDHRSLAEVHPLPTHRDSP